MKISGKRAVAGTADRALPLALHFAPVSANACSSLLEIKHKDCKEDQGCWKRKMKENCRNQSLKSFGLYRVTCCFSA